MIINTKVEIFGASNSIIHNGWHSIISKNFNTKNFAVGGSNSGLGFWKIKENNGLKNAQYGIVNFGVSENEELINNFITKEHLNSLISGLYQQFERNEAHCFSVSIPIRTYVKKSSRDMSYYIHKEFATSCGGIFIDGYDFVEKVISKNKTFPIDKLFLDEHHLLPIIARYLGFIVKDLIVFSELNGYKKSIGNIDTLNDTFLSLAANSMSVSEGSDIIDINTSLIKEKAVLLNGKNKIDFKFKGLLHGVYTDCSNSTGKVLISNGKQQVIKNLYCKASRIQPGRAQFKFCTFYEPIPICENSYICLADERSTITEANRCELPIPDVEHKALICGLLLSKNNSKEDRHYQNLYQSIMQEKSNELVSYYAEQCSEMLKFSFSGLDELTNTINAERLTINDFLASMKVYIDGFYLKETSNALQKKINQFKLSELGMTDKELIIESGLFDQDYYYTTYKDVKNAGVDALNHFLKYGHKEFRNPNPTFNTRKYYRTNMNDKDRDKINPLVHYILSGK